MQSHTASKWSGRDLNPGQLPSESTHLATTIFCLFALWVLYLGLGCTQPFRTIQSPPTSTEPRAEDHNLRWQISWDETTWLLRCSLEGFVFVSYIHLFISLVTSHIIKTVFPKHFCYLMFQAVWVPGKQEFIAIRTIKGHFSTSILILLNL